MGLISNLDFCILSVVCVLIVNILIFFLKLSGTSYIFFMYHNINIRIHFLTCFSCVENEDDYYDNMIRFNYVYFSDSWVELQQHPNHFQSSQIEIPPPPPQSIHNGAMEKLLLDAQRESKDASRASSRASPHNSSHNR